MTDFPFYFSLGLEHITDPGGYDHILFVGALCVGFAWADWRKLAWLVTAFTLGHSLTLALVVLDVLPLNPELVEFLIPLTIFLTVAWKLRQTDPGSSSQGLSTSYALAAIFGLIHGMGFANYLKSLLGGTDHILMPLFAFNVGSEAGQLFIVALFLSIYSVFTRLVGWQPARWATVLAGLIGGAALVLMQERIFW